MRYTVHLFDTAGNLVAAITPISPEYRRRANQATGFSFGVLADDERVPELQAARHCILYREGIEKATGYITARDFTSNPYRIECITNEALLRRNIVPREWKGWNSLDLADAVRDLCLGFHIIAKNTHQDWLNAVASSNVDTETEPGKVLLAKDAAGAYIPHGYITLQFDMGSITRYDLLRWSEDVGDAVRIKVQFRTSADGITWSAWSVELESVAPDEVGVALTGDHRYIQLRFHLYTNDTTAKDKNGVPTGYSPILLGVEVIARVPGPVKAGFIPSAFGIIVQGYVFNRENALRILQTWCEDYGCEFYVDSQKQLNFGAQLGRETGIVLKRTTTMNVQSLSDNADGIQNVVTCLGAGEGAAQLSVVLRDDESIDAYGEFPGVYENTDCKNIEDLTAAGQKYLAANAWPKEEFAVTNVPVWEMEDFGLYDTVTVVDPLRGVVTSARVLDEERKLDKSGEKVTLGLNTTLDNIIERIAKRQIGKTPKLPVPSTEPYNLTAIPGIKAVYLRWSGQADYWVIEHSLDGVAWSVLEPYWGSNRYTHDGLEAGIKHHYRMSGYKNSVLSNPTGPVNATPNDVLPPDFGLDDLDDYTNNAIPAAPTGLAAFRAFKAFALSWEMAMPTPRIERYEVQYATSSDGVTWGAWTACSVGERSANYTHQGLDTRLHYKYRIRAVSLAGVESPWSDELTVGLPGKASLSEDVVDQLARERLSQGVQTELDGLGQGLTDAKGRLTSAEGRLDAAELDIGTAETEITGAKGRLDSAETEITGAKGRLDSAESRLTGAEGRLTTAETSITQLDDQIALKASATDLNAVAGRVTTAESTLIQHAQDIAARVTQTVFDVLKGRVTTAEGTLTTHADEIAARVKQTVFDTLENRVTNAEGTLVVHADDIAARVTKTVFNTLESRVTNAEGTLTVQAGEIAARVKQTVYDTLVGRVNTAETTLTQHANEIAARVTKEVYDTLVNRVTTAESTLTAHATAIEARVKQTVYDLLANRVTDAEGTLVTHANLIAARVTNTVFDTLAERVTSAESTINIHADEIATRVTQTVFDALSGRVTTAEGKITTQAGQITATANRVTETESDISALTVQAGEISSTVSSLGTTVGEHSTTIQQQANAIDLRVVKGEVVSEINASTEGVRIAGKKIQLDADTEVTGDFRIDGDLLLGGSVKHTAIDIGTPDSIAAMGLSFGADELYQDAVGNWFVRVRLNIAGIPADSKRAYIQVKYRRVGSTSYKLGDQIPIISGNTSVTVDDLLPEAAYEFAVVPSNHFGVEGTGKTITKTTPKDTVAPSFSEGLYVYPAIRGLTVVLRPQNNESDPNYATDWSHVPDWAGAEVHVGDTEDYTPSAATLKDSGKKTSFTVPWPSGTVGYVKARVYDTSGNYSAYVRHYPAGVTAGRTGTKDIEFQAVSAAAITQKHDADIITTTSTTYAEIADMTIGPIVLKAGDRVLEKFRGSTWTTANGLSSDCQFKRSDGYLSNETRHTSAYADATGQVVLIWSWDIANSGNYTFRVLWRTTATGKHSGMASRTHQLIVLRGGI